MKRIALTAALITAIAAPAFASDNLARSLGVGPGTYSTAELIQLQRAIEDNDQVYVRFLMNGGAGPVDPSIAADAQLRHAIEDNDRVYEAFLRNGGSEVVSTQSFGSSDTAARIFAEIREASREDED